VQKFASISQRARMEEKGKRMKDIEIMFERKSGGKRKKDEGY